MIGPYWTRLQVGVKEKGKGGKQVWATNSCTPASFGDKMVLANLVATCWPLLQPFLSQIRLQILLISATRVMRCHVCGSKRGPIWAG